MAIKKSELYSSLWASCDQLRGGMDSSQYKDYVLVMLFVKYISDKYAGVPFAPITIPAGANFKDMVALKGKTTIGDDINKKILSPIGESNKISDLPDFDDPNKLGAGADKVQRLTNLIAIFENPQLDFSKNRAEGDDILGDAYEYLMRHFATESGKSKGQFYTPSEVSRVIAKIIGINNKNTSAATTVFDPTAGSGSLLLKVGDEAERQITLYGQEKDVPTTSLARMNMILHNNPTAEIKNGNTLANPQHTDMNTGNLTTFDFVVANPPFSDKAWRNGVNTADDPYKRFQDYGVPPAKNGDYAFLLHIIRSLKSKGKGACILPHGVLFRGNVEAEIRKNIIRKGYIKGVIGLPPNLFYGTGIPACIIVLDKENAENRNSIFMIDASKGFIKDGNKNRLREQDIRKIVNTFNNHIEIPKYSRIIPISEIADPKNDYNLNIPRYIDSQEAEDIQDIEAHLKGGIPNSDINALQNYWDVYPAIRNVLFEKSERTDYCQLKITKDEIKNTIFSHPEFVTYSQKADTVFTEWKNKNTPLCKNINTETKPKHFIHQLSEDLLQTFSNLQLIDKYDVYQHLMTYWTETMQDDVYVLASDGWQAGNEVEWDDRDRVFEGKLIPKMLLTKRYFANEQIDIEQLEADKESIGAARQEMEEEHSGEDGILEALKNGKGQIAKGNVQDRVLELKKDILESSASDKLKDKTKTIKKDFAKVEWEKGIVADAFAELDVLFDYLVLFDKEAEASKKIKEAQAKLNNLLLDKYKALAENEIKTLVIDDKWMAAIEVSIKTEMDNISHRLTQRIKELAERYESMLPSLNENVNELEKKVKTHLAKMGFVFCLGGFGIRPYGQKNAIRS